MIDLNAITYAGADALTLIQDEQQRRIYDGFLMTIAPLIEIQVRRALEELVDEVNSQLEWYRVRLVHEDTEFFIEVREVERVFDYEEDEEVVPLFLRVPESLKAGIQAQAEADGATTVNAWMRQALPKLLEYERRKQNA